MSFNLQRDAKVYVSTVQTGFTQANTFEVRVMSGFSFNQSTETADISVDEAGATPSRGSKRFNVKLNPSEIKFSTYIRPYQEATYHDCPERILWEGLVGAAALGTNAQKTTTGVLIDLDGSNVHELNKLYMFVDYGNVKYRIDEAVMGAARIGFDIQSIAMIEWTGNGKEMKEVETVNANTFPTTGFFKAVPSCADFIKNKLSTISLVGDYNKARGYQIINFATSGTLTASTLLGAANGTYTFTVAIDGGTAVTYSFTTTAVSTTLGDFITFLTTICADIEVSYSGKTIKILSEKYGTGSSVAIVDVDLFAAIAAGALNVVLDTAVAGTTASRTYNIPITGGEININNNVTFLTPDELGVVNKPIGHFTGTRATSGNLTAYLRSGTSTDASGLIRDLYNSVDDVTASFALTLVIGGAGNTPRVTLTMPTAHLSIPTIDTQDVISTTIEFMAVPTNLGATDELTVAYVAGVPSSALLVSP